MYLMPFSLTTGQIDARSKTVTRRLGWLRLKEGDSLCAVEKCMGLPKGQTVRRLAVLRVDSVLREPLRRMLDDPAYRNAECVREGFGPGTACPTPLDFVNFFCRSHKGFVPEMTVSRIAFSYVHRPGLATYRAEIRGWLERGASPEDPDERIDAELSAIGRYWADGWSPYRVVSKLWPESLQLLLPGMASPSRACAATSRRNGGHAATALRPSGRAKAYPTP